MATLRRRSFEHSPWVAREAWRRRPFGSRTRCDGAFEAAMRGAPHERRLALVRAHPELAGGRRRRVS